MHSCKICKSARLKPFAHTASCPDCGVLLCYPYPEDDQQIFNSGDKRGGKKATRDEIHQSTLTYHLKSGSRRHDGFTSMIKFALTDEDRYRPTVVLDYGGGGGQFALVLTSLYPGIKPFMVDIEDNRLLDAFRPLNNQIPFASFINDQTQFDVIFMNDVFEHVSDPVSVLQQLRGKLVDGGRVFIDTPKHFWLYPVTKVASTTLHTKLLKGTVDFDHQQIWSKSSFYHAVKLAGLKVTKYAEVSEFTQPADYYLNNMEITNPVIRWIGKTTYQLGRVLIKNKIMAVLEH